MEYYEVAPNQIVRPGQDAFTYTCNQHLTTGHIVLVPVGKKELVGVVMRQVNKPPFATKPIIRLVNTIPVPTELIQLASWMSAYYGTPLAITLQTILPKGLIKNRRVQKAVPTIVRRDRTNIVFNEEQAAAIHMVSTSEVGTFLLQGITGSGKTEVYIELARRSIQSGSSVIILVPEIALTSQIIAEFSQHFPTILVVHSTMSESERHLTWQKALEATEPLVVIGARSALFTPIRNVGLIVIDECHEPSYKQEQSPRYSALRAASVLGKLHAARVVLGSATPLVTDRFVAEQSGRPMLKLTKPAREDTVKPTISLVDLTKRANFSGHRFLSKQLIAQLNATLQTGKQALIFHNRRGSASTTLCENCGWTAQCPRCFIPLTLHADQHTLRCHICNHQERVPTHCPSCQHADIIFKGFGTKLIENELRKLYPKANIARFDADNNDTETVNARYDELYNGTIDIAVGTQVIAKGLDLPHLRTVGVIQADSGLALPDFGSEERTFQLLSQVIGRVGRNNHDTQVIIQSYQPTHPSVTLGILQDYDSFYDYTIAKRRKAGFPPFVYLLKLTCIYTSESSAIKAAQELARLLRAEAHKDVTILGPTPAFYERQRDTYRWQLTLKSPKREYLSVALKIVPKTHWQSELDPTSLL